MKKLGKAFLISGIVATMAISTAGIVNINNMQKESGKTTIQAYNHTPANVLDNVFVLNNQKYLPFIFETADVPGIFDNTSTTITKAQVIGEFTKAGLEIESIENSKGDIITTGTTIKVKGSSEIYTVIIYGDANGDGKVDAFDALRIVAHCLEESELPGTAYELAANVNNTDGEIDAFDALRIVAYCLEDVDKLVLNEPAATPVDPGPGPGPSGDTTNPTITIGTPVVALNFGDTYELNDNDVTADDNVDGIIPTSKITKRKLRQKNCYNNWYK